MHDKDLPERRPPHHRPQQSTLRDYVCNRCERGQCARCNDRACTCCYGNED